jgi:hypothetical protein
MLRSTEDSALIPCPVPGETVKGREGLRGSVKDHEDHCRRDKGHTVQVQVSMPLPHLQVPRPIPVYWSICGFDIFD